MIFRQILSKNLNKSELTRQTAVEWFVQLTDGLSAQDWIGKESDLANMLVDVIMSYIEETTVYQILKNAESLRFDLIGEGLAGYSIHPTRLEHIFRSLQIVADSWTKRFQLKMEKLGNGKSITLLTTDFESSRLKIKINKDMTERVVCQGVPKFYGSLYLELAKMMKQGITSLATSTKNEVLNA